MQKELSYLSPEGFTVFTSQFLKNRGTCCKSACLHCPFGYTLKKCGIQFEEISDEQDSVLEAIMASSGSTAVDYKTFPPEHRRLILVKGQICGFFLKNNLVVKHVFLKPHFQHQDLSKEMIESYFFI